ncbi:MAG: hypothetical protein JWQ50_40 [Caballeronia mineralivorans]|nr:hypothetical protein [Caballeronia mineralivorans]MEA3102323.1 hypothetical protein [Caballeronia mineralivorans]
MRHGVRFRHSAWHNGRELIAVNGYAIDDQSKMEHDKTEKNQQQHEDRLLHAAEIQPGHQDDQRQFGGEFECLRADGQQAEKRIDTARKRRRDCQHIVDQ